ncbi:MAG: family 16 glycosylhydrolase [Sumerlaeia bacterium]
MRTGNRKKPSPRRAAMPLLTASALLALAAARALAQGDGWQLVWQDEFDGPGIDAAKWTHEVNAWGGGNNELQFYTARPQNSFVQDGKLILRAIRENYTAVDPSDNVQKTRLYTSARLNSRFKGDWLYGRFEIRAKLPGGQGLWPAIWMLPTDYVYGGWAASGEIDIMELRGNEPEILSNAIHYGGPWPNNTYSAHETPGPDLTVAFHTYALEWDVDELRWYLDDQEVWRTSSWFSDNGDYPAPFDQRFHLLLNVAVGGDFLPNPPPNPTYFPQEMQVEYVRVYQRDRDDQTPWSGERHVLPTRIEAEHYDVGGNSISYFDTGPENVGGAFRLDEGVDIEDSQDTDASFSVGWFETGEWLEYSVTVPASGTVDLTFRNATNSSGATLGVEFRQGGQTVASQTVAQGNTGGWYTWTSETKASFELDAGDYILRVTSQSEPLNFNFVDAAVTPPGASNLWIIRGN